MPETDTVECPRTFVAERPSLLELLSERVRGWHLDRLLSGGVRPDSDPALALRARRLLRPNSRGRLADALERLLEDNREFTGLTSRVPLSESTILAARPEGSELELIAAAGEAYRALRPEAGA
jgi:hypothetical protein